MRLFREKIVIGRNRLEIVLLPFGLGRVSACLVQGSSSTLRVNRAWPGAERVAHFDCSNPPGSDAAGGILLQHLAKGALSLIPPKGMQKGYAPLKSRLHGLAAGVWKLDGAKLAGRSRRCCRSCSKGECEKPQKSWKHVLAPMQLLVRT